MSRIQDRMEAAALRWALGRSDRTRRRLAGRPVVVDGQTLEVEAQLILRMQRLSLDKPVETVPIPRGRQLLDKQCRLVGGDEPISAIRELEVAGRPCRHYLPREDSADGPLLVFFHGGAWVYGGLDSHDAVCRFVAARTGIPVLAVDYRLAPEAPFPAAYDDCLGVLREVVADPASFSADPARIAVGGDSAGGNLAATVAIQAAREGLPLAFQWLIYPATDMAGTLPSRETFAEGFFLTRRFVDLGRDAYTPDPATWSDLVASPLLADLPDGLAPAHVVTAGFDPLRDEGEAYAERLRAAGVPVTARRYDGQIHGFFNVVGVGSTARGQVAEMADALRVGLGAG